MSKITVLIIDDSAMIRKLLKEILGSAPGIEVVGTAADPIIGREKIKKLNPDVITLDVEMPRMDGITFLTKLMRLRPTPVVMISSLTEAGAEVTLNALEIGAVDFVSKPKIDVKNGLTEYSEEIIAKVRVASRARVRPNLGPKTIPNAPERFDADVIIGKKDHGFRLTTTEKIIALGASTGGTEAIKDVLVDMPAGSPAIVIVQHIPEAFSGPFAKRMNEASAMNVCEAEDNQRIMPGHVYIAPGNKHLIVERSGSNYVCRLKEGPPVNRHRPSVDVMFRSVAQNVGANAIGVILTGMGDDGAAGMLEMLEAGSPTIAQDERSCVVYGMPREAFERGAVEHVVSLEKVPGQILRCLREVTA